MTRITPGATVDLTQLEDQEPYKVRIKEVRDIEEREYEGKTHRRIPIVWELADDPDVTLLDWFGLTLNNQGNGQISKLRQLLNAIAQRPKDTPIQWFDDDDNSWSYDGVNPDCALTIGLEVILRGESRDRKDGQGRRFAITSYQAAKSEKKQKPKPQVRPAPVDDDDEDAPF